MYIAFTLLAIACIVHWPFAEGVPQEMEAGFVAWFTLYSIVRTFSRRKKKVPAVICAAFAAFAWFALAAQARVMNDEEEYARHFAQRFPCRLTLAQLLAADEGWLQAGDASAQKAFRYHRASRKLFYRPESGMLNSYLEERPFMQLPACPLPQKIAGQG
jgi:hypothetical protein